MNVTIGLVTIDHLIQTENLTNSEAVCGNKVQYRCLVTGHTAHVCLGGKNINSSARHEMEKKKFSTFHKTLRAWKNDVNEHKALKTHCEELQKSIQFTQADVEDMKKENQKLKDTMKAVNEKNNELEKKVDQLENKLQSSVEQGNILEKKLEEATKMHDNLEQYSRKFNLEIYGIPEQEREDTEEIVLNLAKRLNVNLEPEDIDIAHRMKKGNTRPRPIIVRFTNYYSRNRLYKNRKKLRRANFEDLIEGAHKIYINENLTALRSQLFKKVREKKGSQNWRIWTLDGTIYVKTDPEGSSATRINCEADLSRLR